MDSGGNLKQKHRQTQPDFGPAASQPLHQADLVQQDRALVKRLISRDEAAWVEFVTRYDRLIQKRARSVCVEISTGVGNPEVASEICAEVYAALVAKDMKSLRSFSGRGRLSTWLWTVTRRVALRHLANLRRLPASAESEKLELLQERSTAESNHREKLRRMHAARMQLSQDDQRVLRLFFDEQLSYEQVAADLQISINSVGPKLNRARERLQKILERPPDG